MTAVLAEIVKLVVKAPENVTFPPIVSVALLLTPVPPLAAGRIPVTPVVSGKPVALVSVPEEGVPSAPPLTTKAPAEPVLTPSAVTTPVPVVMVEGAMPAPPPIISAFAVNAAEVAHVVALLKYGMPPEVPATVRAGVVVAVATLIIPPVNETDVTVPEPPPEAVIV